MQLNGHTAPAEIISTVAEPIEPAALEEFMQLHQAEDSARLCFGAYADVPPIIGKYIEAIHAEQQAQG